MNIDIPYLMEMLYETVTIDLFLKFSVAYFFIIWIALLLYVIRDISNRTNNVFLQIISILTILILTPFWIFIYLIIRPGKTLFEKYYEEIEDNLETFNEIIEERNNLSEPEIECFNCGEPISHDFKFCPKCKESLQNDCESCGKIIYSDWNICPYCWEKQDIKKIDEKFKKNIKDKEIEIKEIEKIEDIKNEDIKNEKVVYENEDDDDEVDDYDNKKKVEFVTK